MTVLDSTKIAADAVRKNAFGAAALLIFGGAL